MRIDTLEIRVTSAKQPAQDTRTMTIQDKNPEAGMKEELNPLDAKEHETTNGAEELTPENAVGETRWI